MPGSTYWNVCFGLEKGEVNEDVEGLRTAWNFGKNVAFLVKKLNMWCTADKRGKAFNDCLHRQEYRRLRQMLDGQTGDRVRPATP